MKNFNVLFIGIVIVLAGVGVYLFIQRPAGDLSGPRPTNIVPSPSPTTEPNAQGPVDETKTVIGTSAGKRDVTAYHYGTGASELLFVGGTHGGYEWNTSLLAYELMDYLASNPSAVPANVTVTVIPVLNPDGLSNVVSAAGPFAAADVNTSREAQVAGRYNGNAVDLNRNFDCDWQARGVWQNKTVSGGTAPFSEPESKAFKAYVEEHRPAAVVAWFSAAGGVFASSCGNGASPETNAILKAYADASRYPSFVNFDFYQITGDMANWLAAKDIPAISVLLTNHTDTEWSKNKAGIEALITRYAR